MDGRNGRAERRRRRREHAGQRVLLLVVVVRRRLVGGRDGVRGARGRVGEVLRVRVARDAVVGDGGAGRVSCVDAAGGTIGVLMSDVGVAIGVRLYGGRREMARAALRVRVASQS